MSEGTVQVAVNRMVLRFFDDLKPVPQTEEDVREHVDGRRQARSGNLVEEALAYLEAAGYIERCERTAADEPMWRMTADGIRQVNRRVAREKLDPMIWDG